MLILRRNRFATLYISNFVSASRYGVNLARYATGNSDPDNPDSKYQRGKSFPSKVLQKVSSKLNDVPTKVHTKISGSIGAFDNLLGISAVREAQVKVREAEDLFMSYRKFVQEGEKELEVVRTHLNEVRKRLDRVSRDDERYLSLATEEHTILLEEKRVKADLKDWENRERDQFAMLSRMVRESHEKERERVERTKHWSVAGSIIGAAIGVISSSVINYIRLREVKGSVKETGEKLEEKTSQIMQLVSSQDSKLAANNIEMKETLEAHRGEIADRLLDVKDSVDTYALSTSIGADAGTIEAGISLKSLTGQLKELVQLQLARERGRIEDGSGQDGISSIIQNQISSLKEDNRSNFAELFVSLKSLETKLELQVGKNRFVDKSGEEKTVQHTDYADRKYEMADFEPVQIIASVLSLTTSLILVAYEFMK